MLYFLISAALCAEIHPILLYPPRNSKPSTLALFIDSYTPELMNELYEVGFLPSVTPEGNTVYQAGWIAGTMPLLQRHRLEEISQVQKVEPAEPIFPAPVPLKDTASQIQAPQSWFSYNSGTDTKIAVQEFVGQGWDIFHPDFFRPDGGCFDFVDENEDAVFNVGEKIGEYSQESVLLSLDDLFFDPPNDWIYVDLNNNGARDFGMDYGDAPAFSEPTFVGDDLNNNGVLDVGERLCLLNTSKFSVIHDNGVTYRRDDNLHEYNPDLNDPGHGTGAAGIAVGGWPLMRRNTGIAPGADIVAITDSDHLRALQIAQEEDVDVMFLNGMGGTPHKMAHLLLKSRSQKCGNRV